MSTQVSATTQVNLVGTSPTTKEESETPYHLPRPSNESNKRDLVKYLDNLVDCLGLIGKHGQHEIFNIARGGVSPHVVNKLKPGSRVLDMGCGSGIWCREIATSHPTVSVVGADITPPIYDSAMFPENCSFVFCNAEQSWHFPRREDKFDLIRISMISTGIRDWIAVLKSAFEWLRASGVLEIFDGVPELCASHSPFIEYSSAARWWEQCRSFMVSLGTDPFAPFYLSKKSQATGFDILEDRLVTTHLNPSLSTIGSYCDRARVAAFQQRNWPQLIDATTPAMAKTSDNAEALFDLAAMAKSDLHENGKDQGYYIKFVYLVAQKPE